MTQPLSGLAVVRFAAAVLLAVAAVLVPSAAAQAHDELVSSAPADGAALQAMPADVVLTFSSVPMALGSVVKVEDGSGADWADGSVQIVDRTATQRLKPDAPAGTYRVQWRVVSSDSHPIEGTFSFTVAGGAAASASAAPSAGRPEPINTSTPSPVAAAPEQPEVPWSVIGMGVILVVLAVIIGVTAKRRLGGGSRE
ncbi:copper resistance protein CopC [Arthrobacter sp. I2-34]|uniref:Copper resistance protein CopC n=1 Tax=Arthrobacter hankyongi TaxID=2904801 RepID=A0ABS9LDV7_9MICC|nr:copper resistance CopC family protein [Arthrobacter hankyongi]MCG2624607.1 copper resistance protein CopC [Arthrobacter hankyongi]